PGRLSTVAPPARVAQLADAEGLNPSGAPAPCGFDPRPGHRTGTAGTGSTPYGHRAGGNSAARLRERSQTAAVEIAFRPLRRNDLELLAEWLARPHVHEWWLEDRDLAAVEARYGPGIEGDDPAEYFVVQRDGVDVGFVQRYLTRD